MNLVYGEIVDVFTEAGVRMGRIRIGGALKAVALELVADAGPGDIVLLCDGVALSKVQEEQTNVLGHSRSRA
jgi:hydrogenase maturation factor